MLTIRSQEEKQGLGYKNEEPIALISSRDDDDGCFICLNRNQVKDKKSVFKSMQSVGEDYFKRGRMGKTMKKCDIAVLDEALRENIEPDRFSEMLYDDDRYQDRPDEVLEYMEQKYREAYNSIDNSAGKEIKLFGSATLRPIPITKKHEKFRECCYIFGPTGSGKSYWASQYTKLWHELFPDGNVYLFSRVANDKAFDLPYLKRVRIDERMVTEPIKPEQLNGSLVIFDDIDTLPSSTPQDKQIKEALLHLREDLLQTGRHENVYVLNTSHQGMNWKGTRSSINEATCVTIFPSGGMTGGIDKFLSTYVGFNRDQINRIKRLPSRWVTIYLNFPRYILYETGCYLVS
jgi:hypothetical protein